MDRKHIIDAIAFFVLGTGTVAFVILLGVMCGG